MNESFHTALMNVQAQLNAPKGQFNSFGKYAYRSCEDILEAVKPLLAKNGLTLNLSDEIVAVGSRIYVKATATVRGENDSVSATAYAREPEQKKGMDDSQITGTASSYARKYALNGLFCIDDAKDADTDENARQQGKKATESTRQQNQTNVKQSTVNPPLCADCGCVIQPYKQRTAQEMAHASKEKFGRVLCMECANDELERYKVSQGAAS
mgnify:CR=1 FL=1